MHKIHYIMKQSIDHLNNQQIDQSPKYACAAHDFLYNPVKVIQRNQSEHQRKKPVLSGMKA